MANSVTVQKVNESEESESVDTSNAQEPNTKPKGDTIILTEVEKKDLQGQDQNVVEEKQKEEFLDIEKERLYTEAENWGKKHKICT